MTAIFENPCISLSKENEKFFLQGLKSKNQKTTNIGIVAKDEVLSVLCILGNYKKDTRSDTSNILAKVLKCDGEIIIGDKALTYYYSTNNTNFIDLAKLWNEKYNLPFVFAQLCFTKNGKQIQKIESFS